MTRVVAPSLELLERRIAADDDATDFARIEHWFLVPSRSLRRAVAPLFRPVPLRGSELAMHPADVEALRRWIADVLEARPASLWREVLVGALWYAAVPMPEVRVPRGAFVHTALLGDRR